MITENEEHVRQVRRIKYKGDVVFFLVCFLLCELSSKSQG